MVFFNRFFAAFEERAHVEDVPLLLLAPAVMRISLTGKDADAELDALACAVAKLGLPPSFTNERLFAAATTLIRMIRISGVEGLADRVRAELDPEARLQSMRLALTAVFCSRLRDSGDVGVLAGIAARLEIDEHTFEGLFETARVAA